MHRVWRAFIVILVAVGVGELVILARASAEQAAATKTAPQAPAKKAASTGTLQTVVTAASAFVATLDEAQKTRTLFPFDSPQRTNWSNLPSGIYPRNSLKLGDMTPAQRDAVMKMMAAVLSRDGYQKVTEIMEADEVLKNQGGGRTGGRPGGGAPPKAGDAPAKAGDAPAKAGAPGKGGGGRGVIFGKDEFFIALLGTPSVTAPWMIQFGGHHLAINVTIAGTQSVMTPSLPAAQPANYTLNGQTFRPLGDENDKGFALINALTAAQQEQAILKSEVRDLVLGATQDGKTIQPEGILASSLNAAQQNQLLDLAREWVGILNDEAAAARMADIRANLAKTYFAWSGSTTNGTRAYYRIQGPTVHIEFAHQQNDLDHIHTIYRDPTNDYGAGIAKK
jgi:hypothetical protein